MPEMIIRKIRREDNLHLARMIREVFEEFDAPRAGTVYSDPTTDDLYGLFRESGSVLWVAEQNGLALGCCGIYPTPGLDNSVCRTGEILPGGLFKGKWNRESPFAAFHRISP